MTKPVKLDIEPCLEDVGYGAVQADYREVNGRTYYRVEEMDPCLRKLADQIAALKADNAQLTEALYAAHYKHKELADELARTKRLLHQP